mgnify:FL=1
MAKRTLVRRADNSARISYDDSTSEIIFERYNTETAAWEESLKINLPAKRITTIADVDDDLKVYFGRTNKYALWYNSTNDTIVISDEVNDVDVLEIGRNGVIRVIGNLNDDLELPFGADKDFTARYDATNDDFRIKDAVNAVDLFRLKKNTVVGYTVPVAPQDCINQTGLAADSTGVKFTSVVRTKVDARYLKKIRLRASWTASHTDSVTEVRVVGTTTGTIASVSGNTGSDEEAEGTSFSDGELVYVEVAVTTASATAGATTDLTYAVIEFVYEMA